MGRLDRVSPALQAGTGTLERLHERTVARVVVARRPDTPIAGTGMDHHHGRGHRRADPALDTAPMLMQAEVLAIAEAWRPHRSLASAYLFATTLWRVDRAGRIRWVFERFTERARQVVVLASEESRMLKHDSIGTEHILVGLVRERDGMAARVLDSLGVTLDRSRDQVVRLLGSGEADPSRQIPFTPEGKQVLERSLEEALSLGHN